MTWDQSTKVSAWSLWDNYELLDYGIVTVDKPDSTAAIPRMIQMQALVRDILVRHKPDFVAIEDVQLQRSPYVYSQLSQMQGVLFSLLSELDIEFTIVPATKWKSFSKIKGKAREEQKENTIRMVKEIFGLDVPEDIADAIGIGRYINDFFQKKGDSE